MIKSIIKYAGAAVMLSFMASTLQAQPAVALHTCVHQYHRFGSHCNVHVKHMCVGVCLGATCGGSQPGVLTWNSELSSNVCTEFGLGVALCVLCVVVRQH